MRKAAAYGEADYHGTGVLAGAAHHTTCLTNATQRREAVLTAYLDHAASTPIYPEVLAAMADVMSLCANASSLHTSGRRVRRLIEESRESIAADLGVRASEVIFTSGGTESDNMATKGLFWARNQAGSRPRIIASAIEHHAVLDPLEWLSTQAGAVVTWVPVDATGVIRKDAFVEALGDGSDVAFATVMWANNEVGSIQPVGELAALCAQRGVPFHSDAVQAVGQIPITPQVCTAVTVTGHKIGGPHGTGILLLDRDVDVTPLSHGGGQDRFRSGTLNPGGIVGLARAVALAIEHQADYATRVGALRDQLVADVRRIVPTAILNGVESSDGRLPGNAHFSFPGCEGDALLMLLDAAGVECSTGSACTSGVPQPSHVLTEMGLNRGLARGSLRFSLGWNSTQNDVDALIRALPTAHDRARRAGMVRLGAFDGVDISQFESER